MECEDEPIEEPAVQAEPIEPIEPIEAEENKDNDNAEEEEDDDDRESIRAKRLQFLSRSQPPNEASSLFPVCFNSNSNSNSIHSSIPI